MKDIDKLEVVFKSVVDKLKRPELLKLKAFIDSLKDDHTGELELPMTDGKILHLKRPNTENLILSIEDDLSKVTMH